MSPFLILFGKNLVWESSVTLMNCIITSKLGYEKLLKIILRIHKFMAQ